MSTRALIGAVLLAAIPAAAHAKQGERFHVLTERLERRLGTANSEARRNFESVGNYRKSSGQIGGTVFVVKSADANGTAWVLTNHHVALYQKDTVDGDSVLFHAGGARLKPVKARVLGVVAASRSMDYALLKVKLPPPLRKLGAVELGADLAFENGDRLYNPSFPRIWAAERDAAPDARFVSSSKRSKIYQAAKRGRLTPKMMQVGEANGESVGGLEGADLPNEVGSSGSPVFSRKDHRVMGMLTAGYGRGAAFVRPIGNIVRSLARRTSHVRSAADRATLRAITQQVQAAATPPTGPTKTDRSP